MVEGYIKFDGKPVGNEPLSDEEIKEINGWRERLYKLGLIGAYDNGIGFGNISVRVGNSDKFIITGSATGGIEGLDKRHYTKVVSYDFGKNSLLYNGPIEASSESMTHAAVYESDPRINAVIHVHNLGLWTKLLDKVPTTSKVVTYGTPEMANEVVRLFRETDVKEKKILAMGGHEEGVISFGAGLEEAGRVLLSYHS